ncbi:unnamed protein product [Chrysoparadoxa australica]
MYEADCEDLRKECAQRGVKVKELEDQLEKMQQTSKQELEGVRSQAKEEISALKAELALEKSKRIMTSEIAKSSQEAMERRVELERANLPEIHQQMIDAARAGIARWEQQLEAEAAALNHKELSHKAEVERSRQELKIEAMNAQRKALESVEEERLLLVSARKSLEGERGELLQRAAAAEAKVMAEMARIERLQADLGEDRQRLYQDRAALTTRAALMAPQLIEADSAQKAVQEAQEEVRHAAKRVEEESRRIQIEAQELEEREARVEAKWHESNEAVGAVEQFKTGIVAKHNKLRQEAKALQEDKEMVSQQLSRLKEATLTLQNYWDGSEAKQNQVSQLAMGRLALRLDRLLAASAFSSMLDKYDGEQRRTKGSHTKSQGDPEVSCDWKVVASSTLIPAWQEGPLPHIHGEEPPTGYGPVEKRALDALTLVRMISSTTSIAPAENPSGSGGGGEGAGGEALEPANEDGSVARTAMAVGGTTTLDRWARRLKEAAAESTAAL